MSALGDVRTAYGEKKYEGKLSYPERKKYPDNHIFDANKSVNWNKAEVERKNEELSRLWEAVKEEAKTLNEAFDIDVVKAIMADYNYNERQAKCLYNYCYTEHHSAMSDFFNYLDEYAELVNTMMELEFTD